MFKPLKNIKDEELGAKIGLEIHQQLDTGKLFCRCPSEIATGKPDYIITRRLKAIAGESGSVDIAASYEEVKDKEFVYECYTDYNCLVDLDEEPPHEINKEALKTAVQVAKMLNMKIFPKVQVMRKTVIDGSNTSGFQRTLLLAINGEFKINDKSYKIESLCLEEDASKIIKKENDRTRFNLSRLGIPLIEIATAPDMCMPEEAKRVAEYIGMILRSTKHVKRGIGTIRQDVNISAQGSVRTEVKGCQDLKLVPKIVRNEALRLLNLKSLAEYLSDITYENPKVKDLTNIFKDTKSKLISKAVKSGDKVLGFTLKNFNSILGTEISKNNRVGSELSSYVKAIGLGGIIHSDEDLKKYSFSEKEISDVEKKLERKKNDLFIIIVGEEEKVLNIIEAVLFPRIKALFSGPLSEVRQSNPDGTTTFLRPMPGSERMYPETDLPFFKVPMEVESPQLLKEQIDEMTKKYNISEAIAREIIRKNIDFDLIVKLHKNIEPKFIAEAYINFPKDIKSRYSLSININKHLPHLLDMLDKGKISKEAVFEILVDAAKGKNINLELYKKLSKKEIEAVVKKIIKKNPSLNEKALMGEVMKQLRGKAEGKDIFMIIKELKIKESKKS